jgi:E3 ubiquitin-protein ligase UBR1
MQLQDRERRLCSFLRTLPLNYGFRYPPEAQRELVQQLFLALSGNNPNYLQLFFPHGPPPINGAWCLKTSQGAFEGSEYTEAARGHACGHIFKPGEASYRCKDCASDPTCVLCAKCFHASDHEGHIIYVSLSNGHSGCCDCGDPEAWNVPVHCSIHSADMPEDSHNTGKARIDTALPPDLVESIKMTISKCLDFLVDVWSCSPEQLRLGKTLDSVREDERLSRLSREVYGGLDPASADGEAPEYALVLWNDEKHTVQDVQEIVARSCRVTHKIGRDKADEIDNIGRAILKYDTDVEVLLRAAKIIEHPKLSVTIRSARDIVREEMCGTIVDWLSDISGCHVGSDPKILRETICEAFVSPWHIGSSAHHISVGQEGLYDHDREEIAKEISDSLGTYGTNVLNTLERGWGPAPGDFPVSSSEEEEENPEEHAMEIEGLRRGSDVMLADEAPGGPEAAYAGYPPPPHPAEVLRQRGSISAGAAETGERSEPNLAVPKTPAQAPRPAPRPPNYWLEKPKGYGIRNDARPAEDLWQRVRLDYLILYDLRMWKQLRIDLREVLISTVITLPEYKRLLGLRFASIYTVLAELHLIADREPDHSILYLSVQMLTTPTISNEIVEKGNFLTNLMAILYTFLTTRQVGYPNDVNLTATLAIDQGVVFNRRASSFYHDMKLLAALSGVQEKIQKEPRYLLQFLDLAKIHQGVCPTVRAVGDHVEYEMETWMSMSSVMTEVTRLCRYFAESFRLQSDDDIQYLHSAVRLAAGITIINSLGTERRRFEQCEIKNQVHFQNIEAFEFDDRSEVSSYTIVKFAVDKYPMSCYHPLHYVLSWLIAECKSSPVQKLRELLHFTSQDLKQIPIGNKRSTIYLVDFQPSEHLLALFDYPIRLCAWLAQIRANMWIRNGLSLRHQIQQYKSVRFRDLTYHRDVFMIQTAFILCDPATVLTTIIDRFDLISWVQGQYSPVASREEPQTIDLAESLIHLIIVVLCDRLNLIVVDENELMRQVTKTEIIHSLCYKPLSYTELKKQMTERIREEDDQNILSELATFKAPEGLADHGTFTLKEEYLAELDPYMASLTRNQREEADLLYRKYKAKTTGQDISDVIYEPKFLSLDGSLFKDLPALTKTPVFAQMIFYFLQYCMLPGLAPEVQATKIEQLFQFVLHLTLVAVMLDDSDEDLMVDFTPHSFCYMVLTKKAERAVSPNTIAGLLRRSMEMEHLKSSTARVKTILKHLQRKLPTEYKAWMASLNLSVDTSGRSTPSSEAAAKELKKKQALERQAKVMAAFKQQQDTFMQNQTIDWGVDDSDDEEMLDAPEPERVANFPSGVCILCQEETDTEKLYGTFAFISTSNVFRNTPTGSHHDDGWVKEVLQCPENYDKPIENRPFGYANNNTRTVTKRMADSTEVEQIRQDLSRGFPADATKSRAISSGCGHIMHHSCFTVYMNATIRRHNQQIARHHPENTNLKEFLCPLCKALANAFLPIIWKPKPLSYPGPLSTQYRLSEYFDFHFLRSEEIQSAAMNSALHETEASPFFKYYTDSSFIAPLVASIASNKASPLSPKLPSHDLPRQIPGLPGVHFLSQEQRIMVIPTEANVSEQISSPQSQSSSRTITPARVDLQSVAKVYEELLTTLNKNGLCKPSAKQQTLDPMRQWPEQFVSSLAATITSVEVSQRGVAADPGYTLLSSISSQTLTHLSVLSESIMSLITINAMNERNEPSLDYEDWLKGAGVAFDRLGRHQLRLLLTLDPVDMGDTSSGFHLDAFTTLTNLTLCSIPTWDLDVKSLMKILYVVEIAQVVAVFANTKLGMLTEVTRNVKGKATISYEPNVFATFVECVTRIPGWNMDSRRAVLHTIYQIVNSYALVFLRKCIILMHVRFGVEFPATHSGGSEISRLSQLLLLPSFDEIIVEALESDYIRGMLPRFGNMAKILVLSHPTVYELVGLPKTYDILQEEVVKRRCPTTGRLVSDPALCLFCGEIFCSQSMCCTGTNSNGRKVGGCYQHRQW